MENFNQFYKETKQKIEIAMNKYNEELLKENIKEVHDALLLFTKLNSGGKYLRGTLVALGYKIAGFNDDAYIPLALATEVFQTSILIHDDIIDNATKRRGKNTIPASIKLKYNEKKETKFIKKRDNYANSVGIVTADIGLYKATNLIIQNYPKNSKILNLYHEIVLNTLKGEMLDINLPFKEEFYEENNNLENKIFTIYKLKTAYYSVVGPLILGMTLGRASQSKIKTMENILMDIGIAYQIKDDILGIYGETKATGKTNSDIEEYKQTILYAYTLNTKYKEELKKYYGKANKTDKIKEIFNKSGAKKYAEDMLTKLLNNSLNKIENTKFISNEYKDILKGFIKYLNVRMK